jgi:hypothetical protein
VVADRVAALELAGARLFVERLRLEWRPGTPIPEQSGRLRYRPVRDRDELIPLMTLVLDGTLDAHSQADLASMTPGQAAVAHYERELANYRSPRQWWRVATLPDGEPVGFVTPRATTTTRSSGISASYPRIEETATSTTSSP